MLFINTNINRAIFQLVFFSYRIKHYSVSELTGWNMGHLIKQKQYLHFWSLMTHKSPAVSLAYFLIRCMFFFTKISISALSQQSLFLFSSKTWDTELNNRSLSVLVHGALRYLRAICASSGKRRWLFLQ